MSEIWKQLSGTTYYVSSYGRIKNLKHGREKYVSISHTQDGYCKCALFINGKAKYYRVHRLVAEMFIDNPNNKPTVNHKDGNKDNNKVDNLEWSTLSEQMQHAYAMGLKKPTKGSHWGNSVLTPEQVIEIRALYKARDKEYGMIPLAKKYNVCESCINKVVHGRSYKEVEQNVQRLSKTPQTKKLFGGK